MYNVIMRPADTKLLLTEQEVCMGESWLRSWAHTTEVKILPYRLTKLSW